MSNSKKKHFHMYLLIVWFPTILISVLLSISLLKEEKAERIHRTDLIASVHQKSWDKLISETVTSLEMLSLTAISNIETPEKMIPLLKRTHQKDPRYGGIYILNQDGVVIAGSNNYLANKDLSNSQYIRNVLKFKDVIISNKQETLLNNQKIIGLAIPILDEDLNLKGVIVANLRSDYIQHVMKVLTPEIKLYVSNSDNLPIIKINLNAAPKILNKNWLTKPIDRLPWSIHVKIPEREYESYFSKLLRQLFIVLILAHIFFLIINYVSLWKQSKREIQQNEQQKLELVGTLAASTAHEIRNPLTGVKGLIQLLSEKYKDPEDQYYFHVIDTEINRINEIVSEFLILGKPTVEKTEKIDISTAINELKPLIQSEGNLYNVACYWNLPHTPILIECNKDQLKQVILNITKNAFESMTHTGDLNIQLSKEETLCRLEFMDNGTGMSPEVLQKIFNPFYTSKDTGTGLGLVVCKRIIESFGGTIQVQSALNKGTNVIILLPMIENNL